MTLKVPIVTSEYVDLCAFLNVQTGDTIIGKKKVFIKEEIRLRKHIANVDNREY